MSLKTLAKAIILQSLEDLWSPIHRKRSIQFLSGEGFRLASEIAGMSVIDQFRFWLILRMCEKHEWN